jgi:two-component system response regulator HydG
VGKDVVGISAEAARKLLDYDWPGNVRELENAMERAVTLTRHQELTVGDLPKRIREHQPETIVLSDQVEHMLTLREIEERYIKKVLKATRGNKTRAAAVLGLDRRTLYRKLERLAKSSPS